jgi:hypothetical protein
MSTSSLSMNKKRVIPETNPRKLVRASQMKRVQFKRGRIGSPLRIIRGRKTIVSAFHLAPTLSDSDVF